MWNGLHECRSAVREITRFDASLFRSRIAAEIDFRASDFWKRKKFGDSIASATSVATARLAIEDADLKIGPKIASESAR